MTPKPIAIGLLLCDRVIVDKDTNSPFFDYDQPTPDSLAGTYVEATDETLDDEKLDNAADIDASSARPLAPQVAELFGLTLTADESATGKQSNARESLGQPPDNVH